MSRIAFVCLLSFVGCAATSRTPAAASPTPAATSRTLESMASPAVVGACDPVEYWVNANALTAPEFRVTVDDAGRARHVELTSAGGLGVRWIPDVTQMLQRVFHCRNRLAPAAPRTIEGYKLRFGSVQGADVDVAKCGSAAKFPAAALLAGAPMRVQLDVTLDERGRVAQAWPRGEDPYGFGAAAAEALMHHCAFTPAYVEGKAVPFLLTYTFVFAYPYS